MSTFRAISCFSIIPVMQQNSTPPYSPFRLMEQGNRYPMDLPEGLDESHYCSSCGMEGQGAGAVADDTELQDSATSSSDDTVCDEEDPDSNSSDECRSVSPQARLSTIAILLVDDDISVQNVLEALAIAQKSGGLALVAIPRNRIREVIKALKVLFASGCRNAVPLVARSNFVVKHQKLKRSKSFP